MLIQDMPCQEKPSWQLTKLKLVGLEAFITTRKCVFHHIGSVVLKVSF